MLCKPLVIFVLAVTTCVTAARITLDRNPAQDAKLDVPGLLKKYGYPSESHKVKTKDGYHLTMHRIPGAKGTRGDHSTLSEKPVVFLMHGLLGSSADWIIGGVNVGLGYLLADNGYDVWMGNARGNVYSREHTTLDPSAPLFWAFSWDEIGYQDLPTMIDDVLQKTGKSQIHFIGHSQGATSFFVMASRRPEYNKVIKSMHALSPVSFMSNSGSPLFKLLATHENNIENFLPWIGENEVKPDKDLMNLLGEFLCKDDAAFKPACSNLLFLLAGFNKEYHSAANLPAVMGHTPAGGATKQLIHYIQLINSKKFRRYDYGTALNLVNYGSLSPPAYNLASITAPVFLHHSVSDHMASLEDVTQLNRGLASSVGMFRIVDKDFNNLDFMYATNIRNILYNRVVEYLKIYDALA